ncbi:MAG: glycosyltransferase family 39 protein [Candidatus Aegiribacteria sp.]|nr:glycosyltransferase family 39 protein [Candidatus Aegiribacteria sp.]
MLFADRTILRKYMKENSWIPYLIVFAAGLALRFICIGSKSLWVDEAYAAGLMDRSITDLITMSTAGSPHPPLAFLFIKLSSVIFGNSEAGLRVVSALASALAAIPLMAFISRKINLKSAFWAGMIWAVSPFAVSLGQEAWLYGITAFFGFLFIDIADRAWRGNRRAVFALLPIALIGMIIQHLFGLYIIAGFGLYFTVPRQDRLKFSRFVLLICLFLLFYSPFCLLLIKQASFRADRMSRAGLDMAAVLKYRFLIRIPSVFARLIPGGLLIEAGRQFLVDKKQIFFWCIFGCGQLLLLINLFLRNVLNSKFRNWLLLVFVLPFLIFLKEDPTVRHLTILWIPLAFAIASAVDRWKRSGPVILAITAIMLSPYYNISSFPYHRADWRAAVEFVENRIEHGESVLVIGGQSGGLIWDYYCDENTTRTVFGVDDPYTENLTPPSTGADFVIDSLLHEYDSIWIVKDYWGGPRAADFASDHVILLENWISPLMEILHVSSGPAGQ